MAWRTFLALGLVSTLAAGCTAEVKAGGGINDGGPDGTPSGGSSGSGGGSNTGGASKAGAGGGSGAGGAVSSGGGKSTGGGDSGPRTCPNGSNACERCTNTNCCAELNDCTDDIRCSGTSTEQGELQCIQDCLLDGLGTSPTDAGSPVLDTCASRCAGKTSHTVPSTATQAIITCMNQPSDGGVGLCAQDCFGGPPQ